MRGSIIKRGKASWRLKFDLDRDANGERKTLCDCQGHAQTGRG